MDLLEGIEMSPRVCAGKPVIDGTRIPVTVILEQLTDGESWDSILEGYPELSRDDIRAALQYARAVIDHSDGALPGLAAKYGSTQKGEHDL